MWLHLSTASSDCRLAGHGGACIVLLCHKAHPFCYQHCPGYTLGELPLLYGVQPSLPGRMMTSSPLRTRGMQRLGRLKRCVWRLNREQGRQRQRQYIYYGMTRQEKGRRCTHSIHCMPVFADQESTDNERLQNRPCDHKLTTNWAISSGHIWPCEVLMV